jgi:hypothetical protein
MRRNETGNISEVQKILHSEQRRNSGSRKFKTRPKDFRGTQTTFLYNVEKKQQDHHERWTGNDVEAIVVYLNELPKHLHTTSW